MPFDALALIIRQVDERMNKVLGEQVRWTNLIRAGVPRELMLTHDLDQLLSDREAALRVSYWERQQQTQSDAIADLTC
jgi:cell division protein ZapA (FtsZ GTPase activity inhibitor)